MRVAIVGSGPSGFYAAEALLKQNEVPVEIDMFDRLPTPYGLVRGGVAPDHQKIKGVIAVYERLALLPHFRFFGNVMLGRDVQADGLRELYDQIIYAVGNESDRHLGIPGEDLAGSHSATEFVGWYNGHPDHRHREFDLSQEDVAVIGIGNVAMDVTRILAEDPDALAKTDIADYALAALRKSRVKTIHLLGRRGPAQAAFSPAEIREIGELSCTDLVVRPDEVRIDEVSAADYADPENKKNVDYLQVVATRGEGTRGRKVRLRFLTAPTELHAEGGRVSALSMELNRLDKNEKGMVVAKGTGKHERLKAGLVFRSIGYRGIPIPGVPFDDKAGKIPNVQGRVTDASGKTTPAEYVVGWAKRGPSGLIGTNRADSVATVQALLADAKGGIALTHDEREPDAMERRLKDAGVRFLTFQDWKRLDKLELERGAVSGKIREKFTTVPEMLAALDKNAAAADR
ncbi:MAG: FAD-dependent oxidoreductase [Elusimicrobia bacterium]|nr:FAD-dependent oxidoreductase [Elusimicrobiota bacterium]